MKKIYISLFGIILFSSGIQCLALEETVTLEIESSSAVTEIESMATTVLSLENSTAAGMGLTSAEAAAGGAAAGTTTAPATVFYTSSGLGFTTTIAYLVHQQHKKHQHILAMYKMAIKEIQRIRASGYNGSLAGLPRSPNLHAVMGMEMGILKQRYGLNFVCTYQQLFDYIIHEYQIMKVDARNLF